MFKVILIFCYVYIRVVVTLECCEYYDIVLVREFESRRGEILNLLAKKKKKNQLLRAPINSVGKHNSTRVDEGRKR